MVKCVFCGEEGQYFKGMHLIKNDGSVNYFCSSKCRKNTLKLKRDKRRLKWASAYGEEKTKAAIRVMNKISSEKKGDGKADSAKK